jgi:glycosyltransferase involved in cell wall biosynthesis
MADRVVVVADGLRQELVSQYGVPPAKVGVFANGANVKLFTPLDPVECKRKLALDPRRRYIGFVGNMYKWQGVDDLIAAFSATAVEHADAQLLIVGDGVEAPNLKALVQRLGLMARVDFVGRVPYSEVVHYINACEFCVGAFNEMRQQSPCSPLKVYEYLACGKPVLASDLVEIRFIAENGVGALFPVGKIDAMAAGLQVMLSLPRQEIEAMGARARRLVVERFTWEATAKAVFDFVNSKRVAGHS